MARFDKKLEKMLTYTEHKDIDKAIAYLFDVRGALTEAVYQYSDLEKLNDAKYVWYSNARDSYEEKLHKVEGVILQLEAKRSHASLQA